MGDPKSIEIEFLDGPQMAYDHLMIATSAVKNYESIEGFND